VLQSWGRWANSWGIVGWILEANKRQDIEIGGIAEPIDFLASGSQKLWDSMELVFDTLEKC